MSEAVVLSGPVPDGWRRPNPITEFAHRMRWRFFPPKSNLERHAEAELARMTGHPDGDEMQREMNRCVLQIVRMFARQHHSGFSASYAIGQLEKLLRYEPLGPLTGDDGEWVDVGDHMGEPCWQNRRCGRVFKGADGRAYDIDGKVFVEPDGGSFTSYESRVLVSFPYLPTTEYVRIQKRDANGRFMGARPRAQ